MIWGADQHTSIYQLDAPTYINTQGTGKSASSTYTITLPKNQEKNFLSSLQDQKRVRRMP